MLGPQNLIESKRLHRDYHRRPVEAVLVDLPATARRHGSSRRAAGRPARPSTAAARSGRPVVVFIMVCIAINPVITHSRMLGQREEYLLSSEYPTTDLAARDLPEPALVPGKHRVRAPGAVNRLSKTCVRKGKLSNQSANHGANPGNALKCMKFTSACR